MENEIRLEMLKALNEERVRWLTRVCHCQAELTPFSRLKTRAVEKGKTLCV